MKSKNNLLIMPFLLLAVFLVLTGSCDKDDPIKEETGTVTDADGNVYQTVKIGTQIWMAENLKTTKYRNGDAIPQVTGNTEWRALLSDGYCNFKNNAQNFSIYGSLYNWYAVSDSRNIAPAGWHVPTDAEWTILENFLIAKGYNYDKTTTGNKIALSMAAESFWTSSTTPGAIGSTENGRNASGFNARSSGYRNDEFLNEFKECWWWTSTASNSNFAYGRSLNYNRVGLFHGNDNKSLGFSVRCIKD